MTEESGDESREYSFPVIVERHYDFCAWLLPKISKFQRDQRYILGARLQNSSLDLLESLIGATISQGRARSEHFRNAVERLESTRFLFRLALTIKMINPKSYEYGIESLCATGRMLGGWRKKAGRHVDGTGAFEAT
jgi:hypothetical protein